MSTCNQEHNFPKQIPIVPRIHNETIQCWYTMEMTLKKSTLIMIRSLMRPCNFISRYVKIMDITTEVRTTIIHVKCKS